MDMKKNPFRFGQLVKGEDFCNRQVELNEIKKAISNNYSFWIYSPRRFGKTSLLLKAFEELPGIKTVYLDLYNVESLGAFAEKYSQVVFRNLFDWKTGIKNIGKKLSGFFKHITPQISFDAAGNPSIAFEPQVKTDKIDIENILGIPEKIAAEQKKHVCIAFDEFQEVVRINPFLVNWMRASFQTHQNISYIFLGSKQSLMETIFANSNSPFYEFGFKMSIKEISRQDWEIFIKEKCAKTGVNIPTGVIASIIDKSGGHPHFTQYFASVVWELVMEGFDAGQPDFAEAWMNRIIAGQSIIFQNMFDQLNQNQRKIIKAIASMESDEKIFSAGSRTRRQLPISSTLTVTINSLLKKDLLQKQIDGYSISNPVFKEWLIRLQ
ncbi:MAG: ATP-binding protein [Candidatus Aminicenantes bacterium]|nr:ATP-binding protein [Candidatus Aminicenantes bacterium]